MIYGQTPTIEINLNEPTRGISSYVIGACRNHVNDETTNGSITSFADKMNQYKSITPRFGDGRKLYRLGGTPIDGGSGIYPGFFASQNYGTGPYPYDDLQYFTTEAATLNSDMIVGINVGTGTIEDAYATIDFINQENLWNNVAYFELGNELYGYWQFGHNEYACSVERYLDRAAFFITEMETYAEQNYAISDLDFAVMGSYNSGWGTYPITARITRSGDTYSADINPQMNWLFPGPGITGYEWIYVDNTTNQEISQTTTVNFVTITNVSNVRVLIHNGTLWQQPKVGATASFDNNCGVVDWNTNTSGSYATLTQYFAANSPLMNSGAPIFDYIAFHLYSQPSTFPGEDNSFDDSGPFPDMGECPESSLTDVELFQWVMALNKWSIDILSKEKDNDGNSITPTLDLIDSYGVNLVNTEYGSINIIGNPSPLSQSISEGLFAADNILTAINYDMPGAIAFGLFHTGGPNQGSEHSDNIFFPLDTGDPYPVYWVQKLIAEHLGERLIQGSSVVNQESLLTPYCTGMAPLAYEKFGVAPTIDSDGTIRVLILNRDTDDGDLVIDLSDHEDYNASLISYTGNNVLDAPTSIGETSIGTVNNNFTVSISGFSVNILRLTPNTCHNYTIDTDVTWPNSAYPGPYGKVVVNNGATLTINNGYEARFCTDGELEVTDGANVILNGTLTADDIYWKGVNMKGTNKNTSFTSSSTAIIENATNGLLSNVGTITCSGTTFQNNKWGIGITDYFGLFVDAVFDGCTFKNTTSFNYPDDLFASFVKLFYVWDGPEFLGCTFVEERASGHLSTNSLGVGINATLANFTVDELTSKQSSFTNLVSGIYSGSFGIFKANENFKAHHTSFENCHVGIQAYFSSDSDIRHNVFNMFDPFPTYGTNWSHTFQYGISFQGSAVGFDIEGNTFNRQCDSWDACNKVGTQMAGLGGSSNAIRNNIFNQNTLANIANGVNGNAYSSTGLLYECNTMNSNDIGFITQGFDPVIKLKQGTFVNFNDYLPADNIFEVNTYNQDFIHGGTNSQPTIDYYWNTSEPDFVANVVKHKTNLTNYCTPRPEFPDTKLTEGEKAKLLDEYTELASKAEDAKQSYELALEGDNQQIIDKKRQQWAYLSQLKWEKARTGLRYALNDRDRQDARAWTRRFQTYEADILLAQDYALTQEWSTAYRTLDLLPIKYNMSDRKYKEVKAIGRILGIMEDAGSLDQLRQNSIDELDQIALHGEGIPMAMARSILGYYDKFYPPLYEDVPYIEKQGDGPSGSSGDQPKLVVYPNPVDYNVFFDWSEYVVNQNQEITIEISDKNGGLIAVLKPGQGGTTYEWTTEGISNGIIYYRLLIDGLEKDSGQIFVTK